MKYKIGDKVRIKPLEEFIHVKGINSNGLMDKYCGRIATICCVSDRYYQIDIDDKFWCWSDDMFECIEDKSTQRLLSWDWDAPGIIVDSLYYPLSLPSFDWKSLFARNPLVRSNHRIKLIGKHKYLTLKVKA